MKQYIKLTLLIISGGIIFSSCSKTNTEGKMIPKTAAFVFHVNTKSLSGKLSWDEIKKTSWFNKIITDTSKPAWINKILDNPDNSGIDTKSEFIVFFQSSGDENHVVVEGDVKDAKAFEDFNKNMHANTTASKDGDVNMLNINNEAVVGWSDGKFAYVFKAPSRPKFNLNDFHSDSTFSKPPVLVSSQGLASVCKGLFSIKKDSSLAGDEKFSELMNDGGDMHSWLNTDAMMSSSPQLGMLGMFKLDAFFKDNYSTATVNFDDGKISVKRKSYLGKELTDLMKKYGGGSIDQDMIKNIPSQNVDGIFALHFKPEGLKELVKLSGVEGFLNLAITPQGFSIDDFVAANKGDILFAVTDLAKKPYTAHTDSVNGMTMVHGDFGVDVKYLFAVSIGDKAAFNKLVEAGKKITERHMDSTIHYAMNDKYFAISNDQQYVNKFIAGGSGKFDFMDKLSGHTSGLFVDINKILQTFSGSVTDSSGKIAMDKSIAFWGNIYAMGGEFTNGAFTSSAEINLADKSTNSLKQLDKYVDDVAHIAIEKHKQQEESRNKDTIVFTPPLIVPDSIITTRTIKPTAKKHK